MAKGPEPAQCRRENSTQRLQRGENLSIEGRNMKARVRSFGRLVGGLAALLSVYAGASTSEAAVSGTLQGCVTTTEVRANPSTNAVGLLWTSRPGNTVPIRRVLLRLQIVGGSPANFYTLTNDSGCTELRGATRTIRVCPPSPRNLRSFGPAPTWD